MERVTRVLGGELVDARCGGRLQNARVDEAREVVGRYDRRQRPGAKRRMAVRVKLHGSRVERRFHNRTTSWQAKGGDSDSADARAGSARPRVKSTVAYFAFAGLLPPRLLRSKTQGKPLAVQRSQLDRRASAQIGRAHV